MFYFISKKQPLKKSLLLSLLITWANVLHSFSGKYLWLHSFINSAVMMLRTRVWLRICSCFLFLTCNMHIGKDHARLFLLMSSPPGQPGGSRHPLEFSSVALRDFPISAITRGKHCREVLGHLYCGCLLFFFLFFWLVCFSLLKSPVLYHGLACFFTFHSSLVFTCRLSGVLSFLVAHFSGSAKEKLLSRDRMGPGGEHWPGLSPHPWVPAPGCLLLASIALEGGCFLFSSLASTWAKTPLFLVPLILSKQVWCSQHNETSLHIKAEIRGNNHKLHRSMTRALFLRPKWVFDASAVGLSDCIGSASAA